MLIHSEYTTISDWSVQQWQKCKRKQREKCARQQALRSSISICPRGRSRWYVANEYTQWPVPTPVPLPHWR